MTPEKPINEEPVSWKVDEIDINASLTRPEGAGPFPAVIFVAGSGPTDRNWNSPLIPGTNGSGALLARELTENGFMTLRYDKGASGAQAQENIKRMVGKISMQSHVAEVAGGVSLLASHPEVSPARIFALTNSEGCVHAINYQAQSGSLPFAGMVLTAPFARPTGQLAHTQIAEQLAAVPGGDKILAAYDAAIAAFVSGQPVQIDENLPDALKQMIQALTQPLNQPFARELWTFTPLEQLSRTTVPVLIVIGKKDIQVDWQIEGPLFEKVAETNDNIRITYPENANHVMKYEPKPRAELTAAEVMNTYSGSDVMLDPDPVHTIVSWLKGQV